jgi:hypothetical protein
VEVGNGGGKEGGGGEEWGDYEEEKEDLFPYSLVFTSLGIFVFVNVFFGALMFCCK